MGCDGNCESRAARAAGEEARRTRSHSVSCVFLGTQDASAPSQPPEPWAASSAVPATAKLLPPEPGSEDGATPWPVLSQRWGPVSPGPGRPLLVSQGVSPEF